MSAFVRISIGLCLKQTPIVKDAKLQDILNLYGEIAACLQTWLAFWWPTAPFQELYVDLDDEGVPEEDGDEEEEEEESREDMEKKIQALQWQLQEMEQVEEAMSGQEEEEAAITKFQTEQVMELIGVLQSNKCLGRT